MAHLAIFRGCTMAGLVWIALVFPWQGEHEREVSHPILRMSTLGVQLQLSTPSAGARQPTVG